MPQFDFDTVLIPQLFWLAVFFVALYFGIVRLTLPRLGKVIDERAATIEGDLEHAHRAKVEADELTAAFTAELEKTREAARADIAKAKADAAAAGEKRLAKADAEANARMEEAEARIAKARDEAHGHPCREIAVDGAQAIVAKLTGEEPAAAKVAGAVDAVLAR